MEVKVYREKVHVRERKDGSTYESHKGEDGKPYVGKNSLIVADGLGGSAAIRLQNFDRGLFHKEKLMDTLFEGVYDDYSNEEFVKYVEESFKDFYSVTEEDYFVLDTLLQKKSGYFGARIASAISLYEFLRQDGGLEAQEESFWDRIYATTTEEELEKAQEEIGADFAKMLKEKLLGVAEKTNLLQTTGVGITGKSVALLGTTLCATMYKERDGYVEALYFQAGDSRPYMIDEKGMAQVVADQEGADGGMSNCIKANGDFGIQCVYRRFKTPCILFNASDGCFDSYAFPTQLNFEKLILDCIAGNDTEGRENFLTDEDWEALRASENAEDQEKRISEQLRGFFENNGRHDDSSTIAMKSFGFNSFEEVQAFAKARLQKIEEEYTKGDNQIIRYDYADEGQRLEAEVTRGLAAKRNPIWAYDTVKKYCKDFVAQKITPEYSAALLEKDVKTDAYKTAWKTAISEVVGKIDRYYLAILAEKNEEGFDKKAWEKCEKAKTNAEKTLAEIREEAGKYKEKLNTLTQELTAMFTKAKNNESLDDFVLNSEEEQSKISQLQSEIKGLLKSLEEGKGKNEKIADALSKFFKFNKDATKKNEEKLIALANDLINLRAEVEKAVFIKADREEIIVVIDKMDELTAQKQAIEQEFEVKWDAAAEAYWNANFKDVMAKIANAKEDEAPQVSPEDKQALQEIFNNTEKKEKMSNGLEKQKALFETYEEEYGRVMNSEFELSEEGKAKAEAQKQAEEEARKQAEQEAVQQAEEETQTSNEEETTSQEDSVEETQEDEDSQETDDAQADVPVEETKEEVEKKDFEQPDDQPIEETAQEIFEECPTDKIEEQSTVEETQEVETEETPVEEGGETTEEVSEEESVTSKEDATEESQEVQSDDDSDDEE